MSRTVRIYRFDQLRHDRRVVSFEEILDELEASPATLKQDLWCMRNEMNSPIVWNAELRGYRFDKQGVGPRYECARRKDAPGACRRFVTVLHKRGARYQRTASVSFFHTGSCQRYKTGSIDWVLPWETSSPVSQPRV